MGQPPPPSPSHPVPEVLGAAGKGNRDHSEKGLFPAITDLTKRVAALENSDKGFWKKLIVLVGVAGGILALPGQVMDIAARLHPRPDLHFSWQVPVKLANDPETGGFQFLYRVRISNEGTAVDGVKSATVVYTVVGQGSFPIGNCKFRVNQQELGYEITIGKNEYKEAEFYATVPKEFANAYLTQPGERETDVNFTLQSKYPPQGVSDVVTQRFCLHAMDAEALETVRMGGGWFANNTSCEER
jgi:hypothetical protein